MNDKSNSMYFWRVIFTYLIALHHICNAFGHSYVGWYIGVDFFALISGYLLFAHAFKHESESVFTYMKNRFVYFIPIVTVSALIRFSYVNMFNQNTFFDDILTLLNFIPEFLLLNAYGVCGYINHTDWYLQVLVFPSVLLLWLLKKNKNFTQQVFAPLAAWLIFSILFSNFNSAEGYIGHATQGLMNWPLLRVFGALCLGGFCYFIATELKTRLNWKWQIFSTLLFVSVILLSFYHGRTRTDYIYILMCAIAMIISFSVNTKNKVFNNKVIRYLSNLSIYIYLNHYVVRIWVRQNFDTLSFEIVVLYLILTTALSVIIYHGLNKTIGLLKRGWHA